MDEREAEERTGNEPLPEHVKPTEDAMSSAGVSTRESDQIDSVPVLEVQMTEQVPVTTEGEQDIAESTPSAITPGEEDETETGERSDEKAELAAARPEPAEGSGASLEPAEPSALAEPALTAAQEHRAEAAEGLRRGRLPQGEIPVEGGTEPAWYVIHCYSGYENKVRHNLEQRIETMGMRDRIFDVVIPTQEEIEVREGKRRTVERHIFPGYVLVNMTLSEESWYVVRNTPGVTGFVGMGNLPTPLRPEEVAQIIKRMESEAPAINVSFKVGERVRIIDGPFNDFRGTVADIDMERTKVRVMVSFFGRETPVETDFLQVEKA
jgi:transcriptional antiterminator NusG